MSAFVGLLLRAGQTITQPQALGHSHRWPLGHEGDRVGREVPPRGPPNIVRMSVGSRWGSGVSVAHDRGGDLAPLGDQRRLEPEEGGIPAPGRPRAPPLPTTSAIPLARAGLIVYFDHVALDAQVVAALQVPTSLPRVFFTSGRPAAQVRMTTSPASMAWESDDVIEHAQVVQHVLGPRSSPDECARSAKSGVLRDGGVEMVAHHERIRDAPPAVLRVKGSVGLVGDGVSGSCARVMMSGKVAAAGALGNEGVDDSSADRAAGHSTNPHSLSVSVWMATCTSSRRRP